MSYLKGFGKDMCDHCGIKRTPEGHDGCLGTLDEIRVMNACCGHGEESMAYVQFWDGETIQGSKAIEMQENMKNEYVHNLTIKNGKIK